MLEAENFEIEIFQSNQTQGDNIMAAKKAAKKLAKNKTTVNAVGELVVLGNATLINSKDDPDVLIAKEVTGLVADLKPGGKVRKK